jgi:hypothetical protein
VSARTAARLTAPRTATARTTADRAAAATPTTPTPTRTATASPPRLRVVESVPIRRTAARAAADGARRAPFVLLVVAMLVGTTLGLLVLNIAIGVNSKQASDLRADNAELVEDVERLQQELVQGSTPAALATAATAAGLVPAGSAAYLVLAPDGSSTLRGSAVPAPERPQPGRSAAGED